MAFPFRSSIFTHNYVEIGFRIFLAPVAASVNPGGGLLTPSSPTVLVLAFAGCRHRPSSLPNRHLLGSGIQ